MSYNCPTIGQVQKKLKKPDPTFDKGTYNHFRNLYVTIHHRKPTLDDTQAVYNLYLSDKLKSVNKVDIHEDIKVANKLINLSRSAYSRDIEFNISFSKLKRVLRRKTCFFTGVKFDNNLSIDRLDSTRGYIDDNIVACTKEFNALKKDLTIEEIKLLYKGLKKAKLI